MKQIQRVCYAIIAAGAALCCSCQQTAVVNNTSVGMRNYSDAVVHIGQVDPAYRAYFRDQNASNYSLSDQRKAYLAAAQVARTPVREADYRPGDVRKRSVAKRGASTSKARKGAKSGVAAKKPTGKSNTKKRAVAVRKQPYRGRR